MEDTIATYRRKVWEQPFRRAYASRLIAIGLSYEADRARRALPSRRGIRRSDTFIWLLLAPSHRVSLDAKHDHFAVLLARSKEKVSNFLKLIKKVTSLKIWL